MTSPHTHPHPTDAAEIQPDEKLAREYLTRRLSAQIDECAATWAAVQQMHAEKTALAAEIEQLRAEIRQLRADRAPKPSRADLAVVDDDGLSDVEAAT